MAVKQPSREERQQLQEALFAATRERAWDRVLATIIAGADPNQIDKQAVRTFACPLHAAIDDRRPDIFKALLTLGARPDLACAPDSKTPLHWGALCEQEEILSLLVEAGVPLDAKEDSNRSTALMFAVWNGLFDSVKTLLEHGARVNLADRWGNTALHDAVRNENLEIVKLLVAHGADPTRRNKEGFTPANMAPESCRQSMLLALRNCPSAENLGAERRSR